MARPAQNDKLSPSGLWILTLISLGADALLAAMILAWIGVPDRIYWVLFLSLVAFSSVSQILKFPLTWVAYSKLFRPRMVQIFLEHLRDNAYPEPTEKGAERYLQSVQWDDELSTTVRLDAARELGGLSTIFSRGFLVGYQTSTAADAAVDGYLEPVVARKGALQH
jgi:hypothetical protein